VCEAFEFLALFSIRVNRMVLPAVLLFLQAKVRQQPSKYFY